MITVGCEPPANLNGNAEHQAIIELRTMALDILTAVSGRKTRRCVSEVASIALQLGDLELLAAAEAKAWATRRPGSR